MKKLSSDQPISSPTFSQFTFFVLLFTLILVFCLPHFFIQESISLHFLLISITSFIFTLLYLLSIFRYRQFFLGSTPLLWPLITLFITSFIAVLIKQPFPSFFHLLGYAGLFINFVVISLIGNTLIKKNNGLIVINTLITFALATTVLAVLQFFLKIFPQPMAFVSFLPQFSFSLQLSLILLGLTSIFALFFKKGRFNHKTYFLFLPFLFFGLVAVILNHLSSPVSGQAMIIGFQENLTAIFKSLISTQRFNFFHFFFGQPQQTITNFYTQFSAPLTATTTSNYFQSYNLPLLIQTLFGFLPLIAWIFFFFRLFQLTFFSHHEKEYNYLFFILFISCCLQLFTPVSPFIFLIQAFIIAFASDKNKQRLIHLNFSAISINLDKEVKHSKTKSVTQKKNHFLFYFAFVVIFFLNFINFAYLSKSYFSYFLISQALSAPQLSLETLSQTTSLAQKISPSLDYFCRLAAIVKLEEAISLIKNDPQQEKLAQEQALAQESLILIKQALRLNPYSALNHHTQATLYQELAPYNQDNVVLFNQEITTAYSRAILLQPYNSDLYLELANFYLLHSQTDVALNLTQEALKINADYLPAIYQLAQIYQAQNQPTLAQSTYQQAKNLLDPQSSNYQNNLQIIEQNLKQYSGNN